MSTINYAPRPSRHPLHYKTLAHIASQCGTTTKRQALLRREIEIIRHNVATRKINMWEGICYLDAIRELI